MKSKEIILQENKTGNPANSIENFLEILRKDKHFKDLRLNLFSGNPEKLVDGKTEPWSDVDDCFTRAYIEMEYHIHHDKKLKDALKIVFYERGYHPIKEIIESTVWDGTERISTLLIKWLKCTDNEYTREVSRLIFAGGIHRLYNPGCKFDDVPVLVGSHQGEGKSTFIRWLALRDDFFTEVCEIEGQKGIEAIEGKWICEIVELLAVTKVKESEAVKAYITKQSDKYRRPFDIYTSELKRQCIFIGTTNKEQFLTDKTGNRRFYPLRTYQSGYDLFDNKKAIQADILQCWAEAKAKYDKGILPPYADRKLQSIIKEQQKQALEDDYREGMILSYLEDKTITCVMDIWENALGELYRKPTKKESNEIALIMQSFDGWERIGATRHFKKYGIVWAWQKKQNKTEQPLPEIEPLPF